jgi:hypothetical protein
MSEAIARVSAAATALPGAAHVPAGASGVSGPAHAAGAQPVDARTAKLRKAAGDFESLLVKQMLKEAKKCIERAIHPETTHAPKSGPSGTEPTAEPSAIGDARSESMRLRTHNR